RVSVQGWPRFPVHVQLEATLGKQVVAKVGYRDADVAVAKVDARHHERRIPQDELHAWAPSTPLTGGGIRIEDESCVLELRDQARHGRARQTGRARDVGLADLALHPQDLHHSLAVAVAEPGERPVGILHRRLMIAAHGSLSRPQTKGPRLDAVFLTNARPYGM